MTYLRPSLGCTGCTRSVGGAMGDVPAGPVAALVAQVNRFGPQAPPEHRFGPIFDASGSLTDALALTAVVIFQGRAAASFNQFHDTGSASAIERANAGLTAPVAFVTANLPEVTAAIAGYADSLGLPEVPGAMAIPGLGADDSWIPIALAVAAAVWILTTKGRRSR